MVEMVPCAASPPVTPFTCQVTEVLVEFCTVAVNCWVCPTCTVAEVGAMEMVMSGAIVTVAEADLVLSAWEMAVTVAVLGLGTLLGAV